jgi:hypothetical protein
MNGYKICVDTIILFKEGLLYLFNISGPRFDQCIRSPTDILCLPGPSDSQTGNAYNLHRTDIFRLPVFHARLQCNIDP